MRKIYATQQFFEKKVFRYGVGKWESVLFMFGRENTRVRLRAYFGGSSKHVFYFYTVVNIL